MARTSTRTRTLLATLTALSGLITGQSAMGEDLRVLMDLRGRWKLEVGDDPAWSRPGYNDANWALVTVPAQWENQGFPGYDGYAWYRKSFQAPANWTGKRLFLEMGYIDDVDEVYLNGHLIGFQGIFPPHYSSMYGAFRRYYIPAHALKPGDRNVIAVRVYDGELGGGIVRGNVGVVEDRDPLVVDQSLEGEWKLQPGDDIEWKEIHVAEQGWKPARVPGYWEGQGLSGYDGVAWYRHTFMVDPGLLHERLILMLGKIDDFDEVYLNGERIGRTGTITGSGKGSGPDDAYLQWRAYTIPSGLLKQGQNTLAVRVFDRYFHGGIYEGPVGLVRRDTYLAWKPRSTRGDRSNNPFRWLEWLFR